jgi:hypothetical protein
VVFSTREYSLKVPEFVRIRFAIRLQQEWAFWLTMLTFGLFFVLYCPAVYDALGWFLVAVSILSPIKRYITCYLDAYSPLNAICFQPYRIVIDEEGFIIQVSEGDSNFVRWTSVAHILKIASCYVLFITKDIMVTMPYNSFKSLTDRKEFEKLLKQHEFAENKLILGRRSD